MINPYQVAVPAGSAVSLGVVQPGFQVALSVPTGGTVYLGNGTALTSSNGAQMAAGWTLLPPNPAAGAATTLYAIGGTGAAP